MHELAGRDIPIMAPLPTPLLRMQSQWEDAQTVIAEAVARCAARPLMVAVGATAYLGVPRALAAQGWLSDAAMVTVGAVRSLFEHLGP